MVFPDSINGTSTPPRWSPAGDRILFSGTPPANGPGRSGVYVCNLDGSGLTMIQPWRSTRHGEWAYWSPTGSHLIYRSKDHLLDDTYLVRVKADGSDAERITDRAYGAGFDAVLAIGWR
jgi:Tol biopolymer transport system component